jgi:hypothetical protein
MAAMRILPLASGLIAITIGAGHVEFGVEIDHKHASLSTMIGFLIIVFLWVAKLPGIRAERGGEQR